MKKLGSGKSPSQQESRCPSRHVQTCCRQLDPFPAWKPSFSSLKTCSNFLPQFITPYLFISSFLVDIWKKVWFWRQSPWRCRYSRFALLITCCYVVLRSCLYYLRVWTFIIYKNGSFDVEHCACLCVVCGFSFCCCHYLAIFFYW